MNLDRNPSQSSRDEAWDDVVRHAFAAEPDRAAAGLDAFTPFEQLPAERDRYQIVGEIARGGVGIIFHARDLHLGRDVAMKILHARHDEDRVVSRFVREAQIGSQLQHPSIVPIYEVGRTRDARPFFTMKLVRGQTLARLLAARDALTDDRIRHLRIFESICQAVAYAHDRGVIHRDLKPANVMIGRFGEVQVIDWGFAKVIGEVETDEEGPIETGDVDAAAVQSRLGGALGTPSYMAPEQALGDRPALDQRTDVFCLGGILTEILTGQPPVGGSSAQEAVAHASVGELGETTTRLEHSEADPLLIDLALRCLRRHKRDRPPDARDVARTMTGYLTAVEERTRAAELAAAEQRVRADEERRRRRLGIGAAASLFLLLSFLGAIGVAVWDRRRTATRDIEALLADADRRVAAAEWAAAARAMREATLRGQSAPVDATMRDEVDARLAMYDGVLELIALRLRLDHHPFETNRAYAETFRRVIGSEDHPSPEQIVGYGKGRPATVRAQIALSLDDWAARSWLRLPRRDSAEAGAAMLGASTKWSRLVEAARVLDPDPWRRRLRDATLAGDVGQLLTLAAELELESRPPESAVLLALALYPLPEPAGWPATLRVLQCGFRHHPGDFWINGLLVMQSVIRPQRTPQDLDRAVRHARILVSIRPKSPRPRFIHAFALLQRWRGPSAQPGDWEEARQSIRAGLSLDPRDVVLRIASLMMEGRRDEARRVSSDRLPEGASIPQRMRNELEAVFAPK
ncbi:MAG: serine/threonine-protein kinase [Planctomycetota bacterium]